MIFPRENGHLSLVILHLCVILFASHSNFLSNKTHTLDIIRSKIMKKTAFVLYTFFCLVLGGFIFQGITQAGESFSSEYFRVVEYGPQYDYRAALGVFFDKGVTSSDVTFDWKSSTGLVIWIK